MYKETIILLVSSHCIYVWWFGADGLHKTTGNIQNICKNTFNQPQDSTSPIQVFLYGCTKGCQVFCFVPYFG